MGALHRSHEKLVKVVKLGDHDHSRVCSRNSRSLDIYWLDFWKAKLMAKSSRNLSKRLFVTLDYNDEHIYIGELAGVQLKLVVLTPEETIQLIEFCTGALD